MRSRRTPRRSSGLLLALVFLSNFIVPHAATPVRTTKANPDAPARAETSTQATPTATASARAATSPHATTPTQPVSSSQSDSSSRAASAFARLPLRFEANQGQTDARVKFLARGDGYNLFLTPGEAVLSLNAEARDAKGARAAEGRASAAEVKEKKTPDVLRMKFVGAEVRASVAGVEELSGRSNYFRGADPSKWQTDVRAYARVRYAGIYPGVDLEYYGDRSRLEYDFRLAPGADPRAIRLSFAGARSVRVDAATGDLVLRVGAREVRQHAPVAYQEIGGARREVASRFRLARGGREVGFEVEDYDASQALVIDPTVSLAYGAFVGGNAVDTARAVALDAQGDAWIAGTTTSVDFPATAGAPQASNGDAGVFSDAFVAELNAAGDSVLYATYLGGSQGDEGAGIALDSSGNVYATGYTTSPDFPTTPGAFQTTPQGRQDAFVVKLNPSASGAAALAYSTLLGGGYADFGNAIAVDDAGCVHVVGDTASAHFPVRNAFDPTYNGSFDGGLDDVFVAKLNPAGAGDADLLYSTFLGGSPQDFGLAVAVDHAGNTYVAGATSSNNFPTTPGAFNNVRGDATQGVGSDVFLVKMNLAASGPASLLYSTFLGGDNGDAAYGVALDSSGNVYLAGTTMSPNFPVTPDAFQTVFGGAFISGAVRSDAFAAKLDLSRPGASALLYSTYLGGSDASDGASAIAVGPAGDIYLTGSTGSPDFPVTCTGVHATYQGGPFVARIDPSTPGANGLVYSSFFSGTSGADVASAIALDPAGNVYLAGGAYSSDFPSTPGGYRNPAGEAGTNAFVAKLDRVSRADCNADKTAPTVSCDVADGLWHGSDVAIHCTATDNGSGLANPSDASFMLFTHVAAGTEDPNASTDSRQVCDVAGNCATAGPVAGNMVDKKAPSINCGSASANWLGADAVIPCTASDGGSGTSTTSFSLSTSVPAGTEDSNASTGSRSVCDAVGNCAGAGPVAGNRVDKKGPTITINSPTATGYSLGTSVAASFNCADAGSGVATCTGTVSSGSAIDTSSFGAKTFTVTATDKVGNVSTQTVTYSVTYNVCLAYDPKAVYQAGSTIPVKLTVCDPNGNNLSSPAITVTAVGVGLVTTTVYGDVQDSGNANPDGNFRLVGGFYVFNMSTKGLTTGGYYLYFTVGSDPTLHTAPFNLK
jgi:Beta-propeller repeat